MENNNEKVEQVDDLLDEENKPDMFARLMADWRNVALIIVTVIAVMLLVMRFTSPSGDGKVVAIVASKSITEKDVVNELKHRYGNNILTQMVSDELISDYGRQKGVTVTDAEVDQFVKFQQAQMEIRGTSIDKWLADKGQTMDDLRKVVRLTILQVKLIVPPDDIKATMKQYADMKQFADQVNLPVRYRVRDFSFMSADQAKKALETLKKPDGLNDGAALAMNAKDALDMHIVPADLLKSDPSTYASVKSLKPGEFSAPIPFKGNSGCHIMQIVEILPEEKATFENRGNVIGQQLLSSDQKYHFKIDELQADALTKVDTQIISADYEKAHQTFEEMKLRNPKVNAPSGAMAPDAQPGQPAPGASTQPAPAPAQTPRPAGH